ncbi:MAG: Spy/CpxP family protein refolding chaperone [Bacteroidetes bacterium]|nr:Spy/CpxP family protein refolding chaperone [Bacteroidota bacterium]
MKFFVNSIIAAVLILPLSSFIPQNAPSVLKEKILKQNSKIARKLELTDDQQTKIKELSTELQKTTKDLQKSINSNRKKVQEMLADGSYSTAQADEILKENRELDRKIDMTVLATHEKLTALLTPTQRQKLKEYNTSTNPKNLKDKDESENDEMKNAFPREMNKENFAYSFSFNGVPSPMNDNGALLPRGERELLFPSPSFFAFSNFDDNDHPFQQFREFQLFGEESDAPDMPRIHPPKPPRIPKMPRTPNMQNAPKWDFDIEESEDEPDSKINQKMEELEQKLKELEKRIEKKTPKN